MTLMTRELMGVLEEASLGAMSLLEYLHRKPLEPLWEVINAGRLLSGDVFAWLATTDLSCHSCDDITIAEYALGTYNEFRKQLRNNDFHCQCGGILSDGSTLVKIQK